MACGAFVAAEFAFVTVDRSTVDRAAESGDRGARGVQQALRHLSTQLSAAQVGITVTNLLIGFLAEPAIADLVSGPLESAGVPEGAVPAIALAIALILATGVTMIFGELVPKNLAIARPARDREDGPAASSAASRSPRGPIVTLLQRHRERDPAPDRRRAAGGAGLGPLGRGADVARAPLRRAGHARARDRDAAAARAGLRRAQRARDHDPARARGHRGRGRPGARRSSTSRARAAARASRCWARAVPFTGIVHVKHAVSVPFERRDEVAVGEVMDPPVLVPESLELDDLLDTLRAGGLQMALVVDEFGNVDRARHARGPRRGDRRRGARRARRGRGARRAASPTARWTLPGLMRPDEIRRDGRPRSCPRTRTTRRSAG